MDLLNFPYIEDLLCFAFVVPTASNCYPYTIWRKSRYILFVMFM